MKKKLKELNLLDDFLFGTLISHPVYGERFANILIKSLLDREMALKLEISMILNQVGSMTKQKKNLCQGGFVFIVRLLMSKIWKADILTLI